MSVNTYLITLASDLVLGEDEKPGIDRSVSTISTRINSYFGSDVSEHFKFGSSTRGTILPRKADPNSDIDYMVVFNTKDGTFKPQTYLDKLKRFVEKYYSTSEIKQSNPTIVLELQHIKFELVPAIKDVFGRYQIPAKVSSWNEWMTTDPSGFNQKLTDANKNHNSQIKPLVRLVKYWNARNGHVFYSFGLENHIVEASFWGCTALKDYFYDYWPNLTCKADAPQSAKDKVQRAKDTVAKIKRLEAEGKPTEAENELGKFLPTI